MAKKPGNPYANSDGVTYYPGVLWGVHSRFSQKDMGGAVISSRIASSSKPVPEWAKDWEQVDASNQNTAGYTPPPMVTAEPGIDIDGLPVASPEGTTGESGAGYSTDPLVQAVPIPSPRAATNSAPQTPASRPQSSIAASNRAPVSAPAYPGILVPPPAESSVVAHDSGVEAMGIGPYPDLTVPPTLPDKDWMHQEFFDAAIATINRSGWTWLAIEPQPKDVSAAPPLVPRRCCLLRPQEAIEGTTPLGPHAFDRTGFLGSPLDRCGNILSDLAGIVDLGHLRDHADMTVRIFRRMMETQKAGLGAQPIETNHGVAVLRSSMTGKDILDVAAAIAYDDGLAYEIFSYDVPMIGFYNSSFSPEDLVSNYLGTLVARRAIQAIAVSEDNLTSITFTDAQISTAMESELERLKTEIGARSLADARAALEGLEGIWFKTERIKAFGKDDYLQRRNFRCEPWSPVAAKMLAPFWRNSQNGHPAEFSRIKSSYRFHFRYGMKSFDGGYIPALVEKITKQFLDESKNHSDKP